MARRVSLLSLATSLPLLLLVALVSLSRGRPAAGTPPARLPTATVPETTPGARPSASLPPSPQAPTAAAHGPAGDVAAPVLAPSPTEPEPPPTATCTLSPAPTLPPTRTPSPTPTVPSPAASVLRITALEYAGNDEYVEITNQGPVDEVMTGWRLSSSGQKAPYTFPNGYTLAPGATVRVHSGRDALDAPPADLRWSGAYLWSNDGDEARLYDAAGNLVDSWMY